MLRSAFVVLGEYLFCLSPYTIKRAWMYRETCHKIVWARGASANKFVCTIINWVVKILGEALLFEERAELRKWLEDNCATSAGVWLRFGKPEGAKTVSAPEALEEALCFGWIDGQMQSVDTKSYLKYFSERRKNSKWSDKNKALAAKLEQQGLMTDYGRAKIEEARQNGQWDSPQRLEITVEMVEMLSVLLQKHEEAYANFRAMPASIKKTYTRAYFDAKTDAGRTKRLQWMVERLNKNLKPM